MPSRSQYDRRGSDGDEDEIISVPSDLEESESEANRGAEADDDEYVGESSDASGGDEAEEGGSSDCGEGWDGDDHGGNVRRPLRGLQRGVAAPDKEMKSQNVDALVRYALTPSHQPLD
jgi:DNA repair and recombination protein RAD54 and RAD54-like protein